MSQIMTFFTANLPASLFNQLFHESQQAQDAVPFLTLIRTPDQQEVDEWGTTAPIQDFETGFLGNTDNELLHYFRRFFQERHPYSQGNMEEHWMAMLDERSATQSTLAMHYGMKKSSWDELYGDIPDMEIPVNGKVCDDGYIWFKWRVPFKYSFVFFITIEHSDEEVQQLFCRPEYLGPDWLVDYETCYKIIRREIRDPLGMVGGAWEEPSDA
ncbi:hypothetical protein ASPWEDRAFT_51859 [Aspergillus wentii DTO 134E9]|uniref:Uncharacterized protein n=1 Tax=Aspergillus wentii DTO 134E9 TaxID=1073089 RepID=A0A1L9RMA1_ASPWE|nr:uncharacterized protein ASPWEDRAFT_51859 [Aspergillus wentii DTO 134E9]OJJ35948.1 hypothetical protein ASPWEDRAFT_51859 [Aspergillus wentii DTO 134E9]